MTLEQGMCKTNDFVSHVTRECGNLPEEELETGGGLSLIQQVWQTSNGGWRGTSKRATSERTEA